MKVKSESEITQSCPTLSDPIDCSPPGSSIHGIFQAKVLEWGAIVFSVISTRVAIIIKKKTVTNTGKDVEKCEESNENVKWYSCFGKQFGNFLKR